MLTLTQAPLMWASVNELPVCTAMAPGASISGFTAFSKSSGSASVTEVTANSAGFSGAGASGLSSMRSITWLSLRRFKVSYPPCRPSVVQLSKSISTGTARSISARKRLTSASCLPLNSFSLNAPFSPASALSSVFSTLPYFWISFTAVFSPMPATPGILSDWSPIRLFTSISCLGSSP